MSRNMRLDMPQTAALVDELRRVFGLSEIKRHRGQRMDGKPTLHAVENGHEIGTAFTVGIVVSGSELVTKVAQTEENRRGR
jgi:hypothetical protein